MPSVEWETPQDFFDALNAEFHFTVDVCASKENAKLPTYYSIYDHAFAHKWVGSCWMNPPFDETMGEWIKKAYYSAQDGATIVCLFPGNYHDNEWWHNYVLHSSEIRYMRGRLNFTYFGRKTAMRTLLVIFRPYCKGPPVVSSIDTKGNRL